jgi:hypothetical protein
MGSSADEIRGAASGLTAVSGALRNFTWYERRSNKSNGDDGRRAMDSGSPRYEFVLE